jgi:hypothetical protein
MWSWGALIVAACVLAVTACDCGKNPIAKPAEDASLDDSSVTDSGATDSGATDSGADSGEPAPDLPANVLSTSGGGTASSEGYRVRVRIGAPQPMGTAAASGHEVRVGPGAAP